MAWKPSDTKVLAVLHEGVQARFSGRMPVAPKRRDYVTRFY